MLPPRYDQQSGALWGSRLKQLLIANGVAVVQVNPHEEDVWDLGADAWAAGKDHAFLSVLFDQMHEGGP